jgi:hypothetical protein
MIDQRAEFGIHGRIRILPRGFPARKPELAAVTRICAS